LAAVKKDVFALSLAAAEAAVRDWITSETVADVPTVEADPTLMSGLPPVARRLLSEYGRIEVGGVELGGPDLTRSESLPGLTIVGFDLEHATVYAQSTSEEIMIVEPDGTPLERATRYPSLAHYLLVVRATVERDWWKKHLPEGRA
jgi:hypothetical protein